MSHGINQMAQFLISVLGPTLVASLAGIKEVSSVRRWGDATKPETVPLDSVDRIRCAHDVWRMVSEAEGDDVARAWFIGGNPWLDDCTPIGAIRNGQLRDVQHSAQALVDDSFSS